MFYVYILRCADGSYYVGHTINLKNRLQKHNAGQGAAYTRARTPCTLVYSEPFPDRASAVAREHQLKRWSHTKKHALITGNTIRLRHLARSRA